MKEKLVREGCLMQIDPFLKKIEQFIDTMKQNTSIDHINGPYNPDEEPPKATWEDKAWQWVDSTGEKNNFYFIESNGKRIALSKVDEYSLLPSPKHEVLKAYTLHLVGRHISAQTRRVRQISARLFLSSNVNLTGDRDAFITFIETHNLSESKMQPLMVFCRWLKLHQLIPPNVKEVKLKRQRMSGDEVVVNREQKLPDEKAIMALGAIQHSVIPQEKSKWNVHPLAPQRGAFVCAMSTLALSSPNRVVAEQTVLINQNLKSKTQTVNGIKRTVHYMYWSGSKGYDDNKCHILSSMAPTVEHVLDYLNSVTECNRIITRFYKNSGASLKKLLGGYQVSEEKWKADQSDVNQPTNLFKLGYLLGFYDDLPEQDIHIRVEPGTPDSIEVKKNNRKTYYYKAIYALELNDAIIIIGKNIKRLLRIRPSWGPLYDRLSVSAISTLRDFQAYWVAHIKKQFPLFPELRNGSKSGKCDAEHMLFALNGYQLNNVISYHGSGSPYAIISPKSMGSLYSNEISNPKQSIFTRYGFAKEFRIAPHQFRHYLTDTADRNGLPRSVINMWSGRKDPNQIIHYVHSTNDERADVIADILYNEDGLTEEKAKQSIRLVSRDKYTDMTGEVASVTSSGICTQNLIVTPCQYLNDFNVQCLFCAKSCHVAHDEKTVALLREDLSAQKARLNRVSEHPRFTNSEAIQSWFKLHLSNMEKLKQLIELMTSPEIEEGALIRILVDENEFRISNLKTKQLEIRKLALPNSQAALNLMLKERQQGEKDVITQELLELI